jgi:histidinol phosphatase-like PHP family hydrolase
LEISARAGHSFTNGHVARLAKEVGAKLILNSDAHAPRDFMTEDFACKVVEGAGLQPDSLSTLLSNASQLLETIGYKL